MLGEKGSHHSLLDNTYTLELRVEETVSCKKHDHLPQVEIDVSTLQTVYSMDVRDSIRTAFLD